MLEIIWLKWLTIRSLNSSCKKVNHLANKHPVFKLYVLIYKYEHCYSLFLISDSFLKVDDELLKFKDD